VQKQAESRGGRALREAVGEGGSRKLEPEALEENDLVVHRDVGVARVEALEHGRSRKTGRNQRYAKLRFADGAARVPFSKAPSVLYRYGEDEAQHVALGRLQDRSSWLRKVESARKVVQAQVASLLQLHRERMRTDRQPYPSPEPELERQFNNRRGFDRSDDDALPYELEGLDAELSNYYEHRGWNDDGTVPDTDVEGAASADD
jgi:transcription-repair coupling factor (superfamily II helicase)